MLIFQLICWLFLNIYWFFTNYCFHYLWVTVAIEWVFSIVCWLFIFLIIICWLFVPRHYLHSSFTICFYPFIICYYQNADLGADFIAIDSLLGRGRRQKACSVLKIMLPSTPFRSFIKFIDYDSTSTFVLINRAWAVGWISRGVCPK